MKLTARVPATVANLGPGFDSFGLALAIHNEIEVDTERGPDLRIEGEGELELRSYDPNLVVRSMRFLAEHIGAPLPPLAISCTNRIPLARGLGSSASAVVGGLLLANRVLEANLDTDRLLQIAVELEGHADNAAAALFGGLTIAYRGDAGWKTEQVQPSPSIRPVVLIPEDERVSTEAARKALSPEVPRDDATYNAAHAALLVLALTWRPELLTQALRDRLHQRNRLELAPTAAALFYELARKGTPVCVAGSGPTLLAFDLEGRTVPDPGAGWRVLRPEIDTEGANVLEARTSGR